MYQELVKYPEGSKAGNILLILCIVAGVFVISLMSWLLSVLGVPGADLIAVAVVGVGACLIFLQRVVRFRYTLMDDELIIARIVGDREKVVLSIDVAKITEMGEEDKKCTVRTDKCVILTKKLKKMQILYTDKSGKPARVLVQPSEKLMERIRSRAADGEVPTEDM